MENSVTSDEEVIMGTSGKERQRKYIQKKRLEGKQAVTVLLSQVTKEVLELEREKTGESLSSIIERAVMNLETPVTNDKTVPQNAKEYTTSDKGRKKRKPPKQNNLELF